MASRFEVRKAKILEQLGATDEEYHDLSPKGSVDKPIRDLIGEINCLEGLVTTSSCSGRISVFLEGRKTGFDEPPAEENEQSRAGPGGKGGGGAWLFISHTAIDSPREASTPNYMSKFGLSRAVAESPGAAGVQSRYIHLKFEPMILHVLTASTDDAQRVLTAALSAGFRESGAVSLTSAKNGDVSPMVAVRSTGYSFDSIIGFQDGGGCNRSLVDENCLRTLVDIANDRFRINTERIARFRTALTASYRSLTSPADASAKPNWEDADARKLRKRQEGLARQQAMQASVFSAHGDAEGDEADIESTIDMFQ